MGVVVAALLLGLIVFFLVKTDGRVLDRVRLEELSWAQTAQRIQSISTSQWCPSIFRCVGEFGFKVLKRDLGCSQMITDGLQSGEFLKLYPISIIFEL